MSPPNRSLRRLAAACASVLALGACTTVGPNFKTPDGPKGAAAAGYAMAGDPSPAGVRLDPAVRAAGPWWNAFGSTDLDRTIRAALADSPTLAEANANLQKAQADAAAARGAQAPQVNASGSVQRERVNTQSFGFTGFPSPTINLYSVGGSVDYDLDLFGGRRRATEQAQASADAAARQADAAYLSLTGNVALQAMRVAGLRAQIAAVQAVIADDRRAAEMVRKAEIAGGEAPAANDSIQAQLAEDETLLPPLERDLAVARHELALLSGKSPAEWTAPDFDLASLTQPAEIPVSLPSSLVRQRPDILAAEAELHAATAAIGVAVAAQYPDLSLSANLTQAALKPDQIFNYGASGWSLLAGVTAPIFNGGTLKAHEKAAEAEARASLARYQQTVLRAFVQVSDVLAAIGADQSQLAAQTRARDSAQRAVVNAEAAYRLGGGTLMQLVDAQRQFSRARRGLAEAQGQAFADLVQLYAATATDWRAGQGVRVADVRSR